jgi:hypothetical protein
MRWNCSGILRASASLRRPATARSAFQPIIKKNFAPALSARFASTDSAKDGKIYQVIGAVVDGGSSVVTKNFSELAAMKLHLSHCGLHRQK